MTRWKSSDLQELAGRSSAAAVEIVDLVETKAIVVGDQSGGRLAWGQYLDDAHHSTEQWGFYGTSAGIQVLAMKQQLLSWENEPRPNKSVERAQGVLPTSTAEADELLSPKRAKGDLENVLKLAFIVDALVPYRQNVVRSETPAMVEELLALAVDGTYWCARVPDDANRALKERVFPTAYVLYVLSRFEAARDHSTFQASREWLAQTLVSDQRLIAPEYVSMIGLALQRSVVHSSVTPSLVQTALDRVRAVLLNWCARGKLAGAERPTFIGFGLGDRTDYLFLSPEILAALFFLRDGNPEKSKSFVLHTVDSIATEVLEQGGVMLGSSHMSTVDQLWAMRLLTEFRRVFDEPRGRQDLAPRLDQLIFLYSSKAKFLVAILFAIACGVATGFSQESLSKGVLAALAALFAAFVAVFIDQAREK